MTPSHQRFRAHNTLFVKGIEWLVINFELISLKPLAQVGLDPKAFGRATSHGSLVEYPVDPAPALGFGAIHCHIRVAKDIIGAFT